MKFNNNRKTSKTLADSPLSFLIAKLLSEKNATVKDFVNTLNYSREEKFNLFQMVSVYEHHCKKINVAENIEGVFVTNL